MSSALEALYAEVVSGVYGPGYVTHEVVQGTLDTVDAEGNAVVLDGPVDVKAVFVPMPDGLFTTHFELTPVTFINGAVVNIQMAKGSYLTAEEVTEKEAADAAYEPIRLANLKALEVRDAIQALAPQLKMAFASLTEAEQVEFAGDFDTVERRLGNGEVAFARAIIAAKKPLTENGAAVQMAMVAGLDSVIALMKG